METVTLDKVFEWFRCLVDVYTQNQTLLTELDAAIGDADHGVNMTRGWNAVAHSLAQRAPQDLSSVMKVVSITLIKAVGGASGPLYGTFFLKLGGDLPARDSVSVEHFAAAMEKGLAGLQMMGKSNLGDKTMLDAWIPAVAAFSMAAQSGATAHEAFVSAATAAEKGAQSTIPLIARKGRASYLGERSVGHMDPGAASTWFMLKTGADVF